MPETLTNPNRRAGKDFGLDVDAGEFGRRLRQLRIAAGLSQLAFAEAVGISSGRASEWEAGNSMPSVLKVPLIADALGVPVEALFVDPSDDVPAARRGRPPATPSPAATPTKRRPGRKGE